MAHTQSQEPTSRGERYEAELRQGVKLAAADADRIWGWEGPAGDLRADRRAAFLIERAGLEPGVRCLELGAGTGIFTERLARSGCELVAVELSPSTARRCAERVGGRAQVVVGNVETGSGLEGTFDAVVGVSVLHHLDLRAALDRIHAVLRPGGRFAFSEPNAWNPQVWAERKLPWLAKRRRVLPHEVAFAANGLRAAFEARDFSVELAEPFEFLHPLTPAWATSVVGDLERLLERTPLRAFAGSVRIAGFRP